MEFLVVDIGATIAALVGYLGIVIWHDVVRRKLPTADGVALR